MNFSASKTNMQDSLKKLRQLEEKLLPFAFGKEAVIRLLEIPLLIGGHILIDDLPGVGKTTLSKAFARLSGRSFSRLQGTNDTLPQDILGGEVYNAQTQAFSIKKGPIFAEVVLIDEINRMHPKSQSAFLEAMEERHVSIGGKHLELPPIHLVLATQNPIEYSGTYPLPEAQRDRFSCVITIGFPDAERQRQILQDQEYLDLDQKIDALPQLLTSEDILALRAAVKQVTITDEILTRLIRFAEWTRDPKLFRYGLSPRGLSLFAAALRAHALLSGRAFVIPEDAIFLLIPFTLHRVEYLDSSVQEEGVKAVLTEKYREFFRGL